MPTPTSAHVVLEILRRHVPDDTKLNLLVADLEQSIPPMHKNAKFLFDRVASVLRGEYGHRAPELPSEGRWVNKGQRSWA
jgi:hypothetical protein